MAIYHPPKMITNNAAPILSADLAYEGHGKCGCQTIILSDLGAIGGITKLWEANNPNAQPSIPDGVCKDTSHVYKIVALSNMKFRKVEADNIAKIQTDVLAFNLGGFRLMAGDEILGNFTQVEVTSGTCILYRDCSQS